MEEQTHLFGQTARFAPIHKTCGSPGIRIPIAGVFFEIVRRNCSRQTSLAAGALLQQILYFAGRSRGVDFARSSWENHKRNELEFVPLSVRYLANGLHLGNSTVAELLSTLVDGGLVERVEARHPRKPHRYRPNVAQIFEELHALGFEPTWSALIGERLDDLRVSGAEASAKRVSFSPELWYAIAQKVGSRSAWVPTLLLQQIMLRAPLREGEVRTNWVVCSQSTFADELWLSRSTVARGLTDLQELGVLEVRQSSATAPAGYRVVAEVVVEMVALCGFSARAVQLFGRVDAETLEHRAARRQRTGSNLETAIETAVEVSRVPDTRCPESRTQRVPGAGHEVPRVPDTQEQKQEHPKRSVQKRTPPPVTTSGRMDEPNLATNGGEVIELGAVAKLRRTFIGLLAAYGFACKNNQVLGDLTREYFKRGARAETLACGIGQKLTRFAAQGYSSGSVVLWLMQDVDEWRLAPPASAPVEETCPADDVEPNEPQRPSPAFEQVIADVSPAEISKANDVWAAGLERLESMVSEHCMANWMRPIRAMGFANGMLTLVVNDAFSRIWLTKNYGEVLAEVCGAQVEVLSLEEFCEDSSQSVDEKQLSTDEVERTEPTNQIEDQDARRVWDSAIADLREMFSQHLVESWFVPLVPVAVNETLLTLGTSDSFRADWISENYVDALERVADGRSVEIRDMSEKTETFTLDLDVKSAAHEVRR